jgi:serine kinase of HPr protein (carbohydrate metabolism regulator)
MILSPPSPAPTPSNHHATMVILGDRGILLRGPSGAGKTALALALLDWAKAASRFGRLVSDDQVLLSRSGERVLARTPRAIEGLVEVRGLGPVEIPCEGRAIVDLVVDLVDAAAAPRFQPDDTVSLLGVAIPRLAIDPDRKPLAVHAIVARLGEKTYLARNPGR